VRLVLIVKKSEPPAFLKFIALVDKINLLRSSIFEDAFKTFSGLLRILTRNGSILLINGSIFSFLKSSI